MGEIRTKGWTKERPKNAEIENVRFVKIAVSFTSLIPSPILPTDNREKTERRAKRYRALAAKNSALFLRFIPKKVVSFPKKVDSFPKTIDYFPKNFYSIPKKIYSLLRISCSSFIAFYIQ